MHPQTDGKPPSSKNWAASLEQSFGQEIISPFSEMTASQTLWIVLEIVAVLGPLASRRRLL